jgi:hypothetical protein
MSSWNDFNDAQAQRFDLIPKGSIAKVRLTIRPGGYNDEQQGWTGGYATRYCRDDPRGPHGSGADTTPIGAAVAGEVGPAA